MIFNTLLTSRGLDKVDTLTFALVCKFLTHSKMRIILGANGAEDFKEVTDNQRVIGQLDFRLCSTVTDYVAPE